MPALSRSLNAVWFRKRMPPPRRNDILMAIQASTLISCSAMCAHDRRMCSLAADESHLSALSGFYHPKP